MVWKPLPLSASAGAHLPPLLISSAFKEDAYTIHLTDLTHIWSESLDRWAIIRRSRDESTSIDPSNSDQFPIFLEKIKLGLAGEKDTASALTIDADTGRPGFVLNVTVKLPGGLAPLEWPIRLSAAPQALMTSQLIIPLMRAQRMRMAELESLREVLREKDHVIQKVVDKLEASGTELGQVFPQATGKAGRKVDRKRAEERVKGLGLFDLDAWRRGLSSEEPQDTAQLIGDIFSGENEEAFNIKGITQEDEVDEDWWESIKGITINLASGKVATNGLYKPNLKSPAKASPKPLLKSEESIEEDAFQVQATPPHLASTPRPLPDDSTDDAEDLDAPSQRSKIPDSFPRSPSPPPAAPHKPKKLGTLGGKKAASKPSPPIDDDASTADDASSPRKISPVDRTPSPAPAKVATRPKKILGKVGGEKGSLPLPSETEPELERTPEPAKPKKGKLGQIGGKKKKEATPAPEPDPVAETSISTATPMKKLGTIGHKRKPSPAEEDGNAVVDGDDAGRGRQTMKQEVERTPPPRETSLERADKKREQLKRELEQKAKAPVKKKRKF